MASAWGKAGSQAVGFGGTGATIGAVAGGPFGAAVGGGIGAGLGGIAGLFQGDDAEVDPYQAPSFSDIHLERDNPELYKELMQLKQQEKLAMNAYYTRMGGATPQERAMQQEQANSTAAGLQARGLLGTSIGQSSTDASAQRVNDAILQRIHDESQGLLQTANGMQGNYLNAYGAAQGQVYGGMVDEAKAAHGDAQANSQASNQFYSGIFNNGMNSLGNAANIAMMPRPGTPPPVAPPASSSPYGTAMSAYYGGPSNNAFIPSAAQGPLTQPAGYNPYRPAPYRSY